MRANRIRRRKTDGANPTGKVLSKGASKTGKPKSLDSVIKAGGVKVYVAERVGSKGPDVL